MDALAQILPFLESSQYALLFFGSVIEGTVAMLVGGYLLHQGAVQALPAYLALLSGNIVIDLVWYALGRYGGRAFALRYGHLLNVTEETLLKAERLFGEHHAWILIVTKLTSGFGLAVAILTTAGMLRVPLGRYMFLNVTAGFLWIAVVMAVGYAFGNVLSLVPWYVQVALLGLGAALLFLGARWMNRKFLRGEW